MIVNLRKYLFIGAKVEIDEFFHRAQQQGMIEFISPQVRKDLDLPASTQQLLQAIKILRKLPSQPVYDERLDLTHAMEVAERVIELKGEMERLSEEKRVMAIELARVAPFGDFSLEDIDVLENEANATIRFFCAKQGQCHPEEMLHIGTEYDLDYFLSIELMRREGRGAELALPGMIEMRIDRPWGELRAHLVLLKESCDRIDEELKGFAGYVDYLHSAVLEQLDGYHLAKAKAQLQFPEAIDLFAIEGWIPENKTSLLFALMDSMAVHAEPIAIEEGERMPTYMENKGASRMGEDLVKIYDTPAASDKDPSGWVFWFFALFFAMIVADGGYGLLYLGILGYVKWKYPVLKSQARRFMKLAVILSTACVLWGVATASFFGVEIHPKSFVGKISVIQHLAVQKADYHLKARDDVYEEWIKRFPELAYATTGAEFLDGAVVQKAHRVVYPILDEFSDHILLEFSLLIGVIHIAFSLLRYAFRHWAGIGWVAFMVGGYLYFPQMLNATSLLHYTGLIDKQTAPAFGLQLIYCGGGAALVLAIIQKGWQGLGEIANMIQVFADVLSYLRLYALGLAGAMMASTFNTIGEDVGLFLGSIVILFGHAVNILLGLMAGVIHGLRLNFIEWYHYCFDGGGRFFNPLKNLSKN